MHHILHISSIPSNLPSHGRGIGLPSLSTRAIHTKSAEQQQRLRRRTCKALPKVSPHYPSIGWGAITHICTPPLTPHHVCQCKRFPKASASNEAWGFVQTALTSAASITASLMVLPTMLNTFLPSDLRRLICSGLQILHARISTERCIVIEENDDYRSNQVYEAAKTYLATKVPPSAHRVKVSKKDGSKNFAISLEKDQEIVDVFKGIKFKWKLLYREVRRTGFNDQFSTEVSVEVRWFELTFHKKYKDIALSSYLPHVLEQSKIIREQEKALKLYVNEDGRWRPIDLHHPATFNTLAMDEELKEAVIDDLDRFTERKEYYRNVGKAWKRGYLLHGPPGTGKSSLVGAIANHLKYDIYDLELSEVKSNSTLRKLLVGMSSQSILVIEDIDCAVDLENRQAEGRLKDMKDDKVTLSGLLNFVDGLWSSCGDERIIVFTTNYKDRLDPALLRPGRMDMHIYMGYCSPCGFRLLASNYHSINDHPLFEVIEELIGELKVTPAEVAEALLRSHDTETALQGLIDLLKRKRREPGEVKAKNQWIEVPPSLGRDSSEDILKNEEGYCHPGRMSPGYAATLPIPTESKECRHVPRREEEISSSPISGRIER